MVSEIVNYRKLTHIVYKNKSVMVQNSIFEKITNLDTVQSTTDGTDVY